MINCAFSNLSKTTVAVECGLQGVGYGSSRMYVYICKNPAMKLHMY